MKKSLFWSCIIILLDQISKFIIEKFLYFSQISIIDDVLLFTYVQNRGGAWGIFSQSSWLFLLLIPIILIVLIYFMRKTDNRLEILALSCITGGAIGNYLDRIFRGYVVDFVDFRIWPVFNIADIFVVIGGILLIVSAIKKNEN